MDQPPDAIDQPGSGAADAVTASEPPAAASLAGSRAEVGGPLRAFGVVALAAAGLGVAALFLPAVSGVDGGRVVSASLWKLLGGGRAAVPFLEGPALLAVLGTTLLVGRAWRTVAVAVAVSIPWWGWVSSRVVLAPVESGVSRAVGSWALAAVPVVAVMVLVGLVTTGGGWTGSDRSARRPLRLLGLQGLAVLLIGWSWFQPALEFRATGSGPVARYGALLDLHPFFPGSVLFRYGAFVLAVLLVAAMVAAFWAAWAGPGLTPAAWRALGVGTAVGVLAEVFVRFATRRVSAPDAVFDAPVTKVAAGAALVLMGSAVVGLSTAWVASLHGADGVADEAADVALTEDGNAI